MKPYYEEGGITIFCADCRDVLPKIPAGLIDVVITDPPYSEHTHSKQWIGSALTADAKPRRSTAFTELGFDPLDPHLRLYVSRWLARYVKRWSLLFSDLEGAHDWIYDLTSGGELDYVRTCIWDKVDSAPQFTGDRPAASAEAIVCVHPKGKKHWNGGGRRSVFRHAANGEKGAKPHPSTKPEILMSELIGLFSDSGELILDPFGGSGTTAVAAKNLGRRCVLIEKEERYAEIAVKRLAQQVMQFGAAK